MKKELIQLYDEFEEKINNEIIEIKKRRGNKFTLDSEMAYYNSFLTFSGFIKWLKKPN